MSQNCSRMDPCVYWTAFSLFLHIPQGLLCCAFLHSSLRASCTRLTNRQVVLGCVQRHTCNTSHKKSTRKRNYCIHKATWEHLLECLIPSGQPSVTLWTLSMMQGHSLVGNPELHRQQKQTVWGDVGLLSSNVRYRNAVEVMVLRSSLSSSSGASCPQVAMISLLSL